jgi:catechol 2,3-dioxygenase-like lactoylglutathione lyase family enzyme
MGQRTPAIGTLLAVVSMLGTGRAVGQEAAIGIVTSGHAVNNLEMTLAFYRDVFGLTGDPQPVRNPGLAALTGLAGIQLRVAVLRLPNTHFGLELTEFSGVERKAGRASVPDPGAAHLILRVRDLDRVVNAAKTAMVEMVTPSSAPIGLRPTARGSRAILMRDPDGYFVEGEDVSSSSEPRSTENVQSARLRFAMADWEATRRFYGGLLALRIAGNAEFGVNPSMADFTGVPQGSQLRALSGIFPGTNDSIAFYEFKDLPRTPLHLRIQDPGAPAMSLRVNDLDGLLKRLRAAGVSVLSSRGAVVQFTPTIRNIIVDDPNGIHIELYEEQQ